MASACAEFGTGLSFGAITKDVVSHGAVSLSCDGRRGLYRVCGRPKNHL